MSSERLTRHEISWLLAQEARGAARALREGVTQLRQPPGSEPRILAAPPVETTLDALDDAISMLSDLNTAKRGSARRGRIDLAALLMDVAPSTRLAIEPGAGTEVFGDESDLRRMLNLLVTHAGLSGAAPGGSAPEVKIRRQGEWVKIGVELGPEALGAAELERRWLSRMATRHGGWVELEGGTQSIYLPADGASDQREVVELRKELEQAQQLGEAYARELASVLAAGDVRTEPPPSAPAASGSRFEVLQAAATGLSRTLRALAEGMRQDAATAVAELGETSALAQSLQRRASATNELLADLSLAADCPVEEARAEIDLVQLVRDVVAEVEPRRSRHGVELSLRLATSLPLQSRPRTLRALLKALLNGGFSATPRDGTVTLSAYAVEGGALLTVEDGGTVVPEASRQALLKHRADPTSFGRPAGVALLIADAAAEQLGARLELRDGADGKSEFWALLPR